MAPAQPYVVYGALIIGSLCFLLYAIDGVLALLRKPAAIEVADKAAQTARELSQQATADPAALAAAPIDLGVLATAAAKLAEALLKAGPALTALIGAVLFYMIAGAGAFYDSGKAEQPDCAKNPAAVGCPKQG